MFQQVVIRDGRKVVILEAGTVYLGIGAGTHPNDNVADFYIARNGTAGTDPNQALDAILGDQLLVVDGSRWNAHARTHHGY